MGEVMQQVNAMGGTLREQRLNAASTNDVVMVNGVFARKGGLEADESR